MKTTASASSLSSATTTASIPTCTTPPPMDPKNKQDKSWQLFRFDVESLDDSRWWRAGLAGSIAGLCEHTLLYPIDTVKTRMQAVLVSTSNTSHQNSFINTFKQIVKYEKPITLFRGWPAVVVAAVPSHGIYFGTYEVMKYKLGVQSEVMHPFKIALAGACAASAHDAIVTPFDVVKQRMQLQNCPYANVCSCAMGTLRNEGYGSFFRSYPTTVLLNIPTFSTNFVVYESSKIALKGTILESEESWFHHLIAGGIAGGIAGLVSNPLDVIKTAIQTDTSHGYKSIGNTVQKIVKQNPTKPFRVFLSGATARATYMIPSAAITWTVYEAMKTYLGFPMEDVPMF